LSYGAMYNGDNSAAAPLHASTLKHWGRGLSQCPLCDPNSDEKT
jgi:hypothetical protein